MRIQFCCPVCLQPLSADSRHAGQSVPCPACKEELTVPTQAALECEKIAAGAGESSPARQDHERPPLSHNRHLRFAFLASLLLVAVFGAGTVAAIVLIGKGSVREQDAAPGQANGETGTRAVAQTDKIADAQTTRTSPADESDDGIAETEEPGEALGPPVLAHRAAAGPPLLQVASTSGNSDGPGKDLVKKEAVPPQKAGAHPGVPAAQLQAQAPEKKSTTSVRERWASKRRSRLTDEELRLQLLLPPEVDLDSAPGTTRRVISLSGKSAGTGLDVIPQLSARRIDLLGLPLHQGQLARVGREEALDLTVLSQRLRLQIQTALPSNAGSVIDPRPDADVLRQRLLNDPLREAWLQPQAIATLRQLLMADHKNVRMVLVEILSKIDGRLASMALAERAVFDLDAEVRLAALVALKLRPSSEYMSALIAGLRYPFPAFADHAAEALVALDLRDAAPKLFALLDTRELADPYPVNQGKTRRVMVPELVRINHLRNCLLCHAYSASPSDPVRGLVPNAEHLVPLPSSGARTVTKGWGGGGGSGSTPKVLTQTFVRADINFLRQDFSVVQPVPRHGRLWPADQRYDYLIRLRPLSGNDLLTWQDKVKDFRPAEPQREALLFALRELTGENPGPTPDDWKRLYSTITGKRHQKPLESKDQVQHFKDCLLDGAPLQQAEHLAVFKDKSGSVYDIALAQAIPQMKPELQKTARSILVDRLYCLPLKVLGERLGNSDPELRRAAVSVSRQRKLKALVPELIALLDDGNQELAKQVHDLLQQLAARDFGPHRGADSAQRREAIAAWRDWWEQEHEKLAAQKRPGS